MSVLAPPAELLREPAYLARSGPADPVAPTSVDTLADHVARVGLRPTGGAWLLDAVAEAGLTGHGGGHVPTALKWRAALSDERPLTIAANGAESEPLSAKDGTLLRQRPHLVLDGLALAAETLGARRAVVWLHGDDLGAARALEIALAERWGEDPPVEIILGPVHYLAGEARAISQALAGGPTLPTARRPGAGSNTLVQNVETLARLALVARGGPVPATTLVTLVGPAGRQVREVPAEACLADLGLTGPPEPRAVLLGGFGGQWARWRDVAEVPLAEPAMRATGLSLGAGVVVPLDPGACGIAETAAMAGYLASMSARQCGPCLFGLPALAEALQRLADGRASRTTLTGLEDDLDAVRGRGACHHPDGAVRLVASALAVFADDVAAHRRGRPCPGAS